MFSVGTSLLVWEYTSSQKKAEAKAAEQRAQKAAEQQELTDRIDAIHARLDEIEQELL